MDVISPAAWQDISTVTVVVFFVFTFIVSLSRGWLVVGSHHREMMKAKDDTIAELRGERQDHRSTIQTQADTIREQMVNGEVSTHLLEALRDARGGGGGQ